MSTTKKTTNNATTNNANTENKKIDVTKYLNHMNDVNEFGELINGYKNGHQLSLVTYCGILVNAKSSQYRPSDAYVRFNNNTQFQLQYSDKSKTFIGFNIRLCAKSHVEKFTKWFKKFDKCNDNARIIKTEYIPFDHFSDVINELINLPTFDRDEIVNVKKVTA